jgi:hypothetical protein
MRRMATNSLYDATFAISGGRSGNQGALPRNLGYGRNINKKAKIRS